MYNRSYLFVLHSVTQESVTVSQVPRRKAGVAAGRWVNR